MLQSKIKLPRFICLEGLDGVGKTEIAISLASKLGFEFYQSPGGSFGAARSIVDNGDLAPLTRYFFFRAASQNDSFVVNDLLKNRGVICDRYIYSTLAYHAAMDERIHSIFEMTDLILPDRTILLVARDEVRKRRIQERTRATRIELDDLLQKKIDAIYRSGDCEIFDTSDTTVEEATQKILSLLFD